VDKARLGLRQTSDERLFTAWTFSLSARGTWIINLPPVATALLAIHLDGYVGNDFGQL